MGRKKVISGSTPETATNTLNTIMSKVMNRILSVALKATKKSSCRNHKVVAIAFKGNSIRGIGINDTSRTSKRSKTVNGWIHAEFALVENLRDLTGIDVLVIRETPTKIGMARPCVHCLSVLRRANVRNIYFTTTDGNIERL